MKAHFLSPLFDGTQIVHIEATVYLTCIAAAVVGYRDSDSGAGRQGVFGLHKFRTSAYMFQLYIISKTIGIGKPNAEWYFGSLGNGAKVA